MGAATPVVVVDSPSDGLARELVGRGITKHVAETLARALPTAQIARQLAIYDRLRISCDEDERITPGRLRRMVEEDWAPPAHLAREPERATNPHDAIGKAHGAVELGRSPGGAGTAAREQAERAALGLREEDQALWARVVQAAPVLPPLFRTASLHAPTRESPGALIFGSHADCRRAQGADHRATRARVLARLAAELGWPDIRLGYFVYADLLAMLRAPGDGETGDAVIEDAGRLP